MDVQVRDAVEEDAETLSTLVDFPADALRNVVHDRTVRLAVEQSSDSESRVDAADDDTESIRGFVAFDVREGTVHVTQLAGDAAAAERLLEEPVRFAANEGFDVAFVVPDSDESAIEAAESAGFEDVGSGPYFDSEPTTRYRFHPGG